MLLINIMVSCSVDVLGGHDLTGYYGRDDGRGAPRGMREGDSLAASYERYLRGGVHMVSTLRNKFQVLSTSSFVRF